MVDFPDDTDDDAVGGEFVDLDSGLGQPASLLPARVVTSWLREFTNVLAATGRVPENGNDTQLRDSILDMAGTDSNGLDNSDFSMWQRSPNLDGTTNIDLDEALSGVQARFMPDRWFVESNDGGNLCVMTRQWVDLNGTIVSGLQFDTSLSGQIMDGAEVSFRQRIENVARFAGHLVTVSVDVVKTTAVDGEIEIDLQVVQNYGTAAGAGSPVTTNFTAVPSSTLPFAAAYRVSWSFLMPALNLASWRPRLIDDSYTSIKFIVRGTGSGGASQYTLTFVGPKIQFGSSATPYKQPPVTETRARCERFYQRSYALNEKNGLVSGDNAAAGYDAGTQANALRTRLRVPMRGIPVVKWYSPVSGTGDRVRWNGADATVSSTVDEGCESTGSPIVSAPQSVSACFGHWTADAEL